MPALTESPFTSTRTRGLRRLVVVSSAAALAVAPLALMPSPAQADDSHTLTVVGTSDVFDSHLVQEVLEPRFEQYEEDHGKDIDLKYVSLGTGAAITYAETGTASALLVHAASSENQFVSNGYSLEPFGRAIFYGDYVLLGPATDPAGVAANDPHDIVGAFEDIAAAGEAGHANFVSRGGTPGTTVQEHAIWALTTGVQTCDVSSVGTAGGGKSPSTVSGACPAAPTPIPYPAWYHATGLTQGPNIINGDACNYTTAISDGNNNCYVFTDRGTYNYLKATGAISKLGIVTRDNSDSAPGGNTLLINSFHAYGVNPDKFASGSGVQINSEAATDFLNWITSPATQRAVGKYLTSTGDAPFLPDAAPATTPTSTLPANVAAGSTIHVTGSIQNVVPGTPALDGKTVKLVATPTNGLPTTVATGTTNGSGNFSINYKPTYNASYSIATDQITQLEIPNPPLNPPFSDLLAPASATIGRTTVTGAVTVSKVTVAKGKVTFTGTVSPKASDGSVIRLYGAKPAASAPSPLPFIAKRPVADGSKKFSVTFPLAKGKWSLQLGYVNPGLFEQGKSAPQTVKVP